MIWPARRLDRRARTGVAAVIGAATRAAGTLPESEALLEVLLEQTERLRDARLRLLEPPAVRRRRGGEAAPSRRALVIDEQWPRPDHDAGSQAVLSHMRALRRLGWRVEFVAARAMARDAHAAALLEADGICLSRRARGRFGRGGAVPPARPIRLVYLHRVGTAAAYAGLARQHQRLARLVYSVADLHHLRLARQAAVEARPELHARRAQCARRSRCWRCARWTRCITHSAAEARMVAREAPGARVHVVPGRCGRGRAMRCGAARGVSCWWRIFRTPNLDGADWLVAEVMPRVWAEPPDISARPSSVPDLPAALGKRSSRRRRGVRLLRPRARPGSTLRRGAAGGSAAAFWRGGEGQGAGGLGGRNPVRDDADRGRGPAADRRTSAARCRRRSGIGAVDRRPSPRHRRGPNASRRAGRALLRRYFSRKQESTTLAAAIAVPSRPAALVRPIAMRLG